MGTSFEHSYFVSCPSDEYKDDGKTSNNHDVRLLEYDSPKLLQEQTDKLCVTLKTPEVRDDNEACRSIDNSCKSTEKSEIGSETGFFCCIFWSSDPILTNISVNTWGTWNCIATDTESEQCSLNESPTDLVTNSERGKTLDTCNDDSFVLSKTVSSDDRYQLDLKALQDNTAKHVTSLSAPPIDPYRILQIRTDATKAEITHAYKRLALLHHPRRCSNENIANTKRSRLIRIAHDESYFGLESKQSVSSIDSTSMDNREIIFTLISVAYETLIDRDSRNRLDQLQRQVSQRAGGMESTNGLNHSGHVKLHPTSTVSSHGLLEENAVLQNSNKKRYVDAAAKHCPIFEADSNLRLATLNELKTPRTCNNQKLIYQYPTFDTTTIGVNSLCLDRTEVSQQILRTSDIIAKQQNSDVGTGSCINVEQTCNINQYDKQFKIEPDMDDRPSIVSQATMTTTATAPRSVTTVSNQHERATKISCITTNVTSKQRIHDIVKGSHAKHRQQELKRTNSSSSSSSSASFAISDFVGSSNSSGVNPIYNFVNRSTNTASGTSSEPADLVHYTTTETNRLFGGPLSILYQSRRYRYFTDPYILFDQVFHTGALTKRTGSNTTRNIRRQSLVPNCSKKVNRSCDNRIGRQALPIPHIDNRFPNLAVMKASSILDLQRRNAIRQMTEQKNLFEMKKQKEYNSKRLIEMFTSVGSGKLKTTSAGSLDTVNKWNDDNANAAIVGWYPTPMSPSKAIVTRQHVYEKLVDNTRAPAYVQTTSRTYSDLNENMYPPNSIVIRPNVVVPIPQSKRIIRTSRTYKDPRTGTVKTSITVHTEYDRDDYSGVDTQNNLISSDVQQQMIQPTTTISTNYCHLHVCHDVLSIIRNSVNVILYPESFKDNA